MGGQYQLAVSLGPTRSPGRVGGRRRRSHAATDSEPRSHPLPGTVAGSPGSLAAFNDRDRDGQATRTRAGCQPATDPAASPAARPAASAGLPGPGCGQAESGLALADSPRRRRPGPGRRRVGHPVPGLPVRPAADRVALEWRLRVRSPGRAAARGPGDSDRDRHHRRGGPGGHGASGSERPVRRLAGSGGLSLPGPAESESLSTVAGPRRGALGVRHLDWQVDGRGARPGRVPAGGPPTSRATPAVIQAGPVDPSCRRPGPSPGPGRAGAHWAGPEPGWAVHRHGTVPGRPSDGHERVPTRSSGPHWH